MRIAELDDESEKMLLSRFISKDDPNYPTDALHIFAENKPGFHHNNYMLSLNQNPFFSINAIDEYPKNVSQSAITGILKRNQSETGGLASKVDLKKEARVMLTTNVCVDDRLSNGQLGTVRKIAINNQNQIEKIYIEFDDSRVGLKARNNDRCAYEHNWVPIERVEANIKIRANKDSSPSIKRTQFPLMFSWACTVHKVQGQTLDKVVFSFELEKQRSFNSGQIYVALSRVTLLNGLFLVGTYKPNAIKADKKAVLEYERMRTDCILEPTQDCNPVRPKPLTVAVLNTRSLSKHAVDIACDCSLVDNDILCLTETQLLPAQQTSHIERLLNKYEIIYNTSPNKFQGLALSHCSNVTILDHLKSEGISLLKFEKNTFHEAPLTMLLLYRKQAWPIPSFTDALSQLLFDPIDIILGDFNIDAFDMPNSLVLLLQEFSLVVQGSTHLSGSQLDHVYVSNRLLQQMHLQAIIRTVHFSDHDAVKFTLSKK